MIFTTKLIEKLIICPKRVTEAPTRDFREQNRHLRKDMAMQATDGTKWNFEAFWRQSIEFVEDFSLGLVFLSPGGKRITLIRFNGQHQQSNNPFDLSKIHFQYHRHKATEKNLNEGRLEKHPAESTRRYASFEEATVAFLAAIGLSDTDIAFYFPGLEQLPLPLFRYTGDIA